VLVLREIEELDYRQIATVVSVPIGTVMSRLARARAALRTLWLQENKGELHGVP
jgi:RNA polymerase sigma-70 factor (ECF subfamily)